MIGIDDDTDFKLVDCIENSEYSVRYIRNGHRSIVPNELIRGTAQHDLPAIADKRNVLRLTTHHQPAFEQDLQSSIKTRLRNLAVQNEEYFAQPSASGAAVDKKVKVRRSSSSLSESSGDVPANENVNISQGACCMELVRYTGPTTTEDLTVAIKDDNQPVQLTESDAVRQLQIKLCVLKEKFTELQPQQNCNRTNL